MEQEQESTALSSQLRTQEEQMHKLHLRMSTARATSSTGAANSTATQKRSEEREHELQRQFEEREDELNAQIADLTSKLDAAKTENLTLCLEVEDVVTQFQSKSAEVRADRFRMHQALDTWRHAAMPLL